jgi:hypothetical protein
MVDASPDGLWPHRSTTCVQLRAGGEKNPLQTTHNVFLKRLEAAPSFSRKEV